MQAFLTKVITMSYLTVNLVKVKYFKNYHSYYYVIKMVYYSLFFFTTAPIHFFGKKNELIVYTKPQIVRYREVFTYVNKWLSQIDYFDNKDTNYATDTWKWNAKDSTGTLTTTINNNKTWIDQFSEAKYNKCITFYNKLGIRAD